MTSPPHDQHVEATAKSAKPLQGQATLAQLNDRQRVRETPDRNGDWRVDHCQLPAERATLLGPGRESCTRLSHRPLPDFSCEAIMG